MNSLARKKLYGLIHQGAYRMEGVDDQDHYRTFLMMQVGKESCTEMSIDELMQIVDHLKIHGMILSEYSITAAQKYRIKNLATELGFQSINAPNFEAFCLKTTKRKPKKLNRKLASQLIVALENWIEYKQKDHEVPSL